MDHIPLDALLRQREEIEKALSRLDIGLLIFGAIVAIALTVETALGIKHYTSNRRLRAVQEQIDTEKDKKAIGLQDQVEKLNYAQARRIIPPEVRSKLISQLMKYRGQQFRILPVLGDDESVAFVAILTRTLGNAGWIEDKTVSSIPNIIGPTSKPGLMITQTISTTWATAYLNEDEISPLPEALKALLNFFPTGTPILIGDGVPKGTMVIEINPMPPLEPASTNQVAALLKDIQAAEARLNNFAKFLPIVNDRKFTQAMAQYRGQRFSIYSPLGDADADFTAEYLATQLRGAQWKQTNGKSAHAEYVLDFDKILIGVSPADQAANKIPAAATALLGELKKMGTVNPDQSLRAVEGTRHDEITIRVGLVPPIYGPPPQ